jgi:hypothetical protein
MYFIGILPITFAGCTKFYALNPVVSTDIAFDIGPDKATCGGWVSDEGGGPVTARGICWSKSPRPDTEDSLTTSGTGMGYFTSTITGLEPNTTYNFRAYAINSYGIAYGINNTFTTTSKNP